MDMAIRDFNRDAPGRSRNNSNKMTAAANQLRLEEKNFTTPSPRSRGFSFYDLQRPPPACLIEEVQHHFAQEQKPVTPLRLAILILRRLTRPVNEHGPPDYVFLRNEAPVSAIQAHPAVVSHRKVMPLWHDNVAPLNERMQIHNPIGIDAVFIRGRHCRKLVAVTIRRCLI